MSTTFDVIPVSRTNVNFGELLELSQRHVNAFLDDFEIEKQVELRAELIGETARRNAAFDEIFEWPRKTYAWISVRDVPGGTDVYCDTIKCESDPDQPCLFLDEMKAAPNYSTALEERLKAAFNHDRYWSFRRSAGQPAIIAVAYGLIAASLAELTDGLIYSSDSAWDYQVFPATGPEFRDIYFRPKSTSEPGRADWVKRCIDGLRGGEF